MLERSSYLLDLAAETGPRDLILSWAELCSRWAMASARVQRTHDAERALLKQQALARAAGAQEVEVEAIQALAVVRRRHGDVAGEDGGSDHSWGSGSRCREREGGHAGKELLWKVAPKRPSVAAARDRRGAMVGTVCAGMFAVVIGIILQYQLI